MTTDRVVFLVNPASDNGATGRRWPELAHKAATAGLDAQALLSERPGHLSELARQAALDGAAVLVVVGGDGSVFEVANGLIGVPDPPDLAVIARGTGWDFVRTYGIPRNVEEAVKVALDTSVRTIDLGRASYRTWDGSDSEAVFANVASAGMSGAIAKRANETSKRLGGKLSYLWATFGVFAGWSATELRVSVDGEARVGKMFDVVVANGRYFGGGMNICPGAEPDDGLFDVLLIGDVTRSDLVRTMPKIYRGTHLPHPKGELLRGRVVTIEADEHLPIQLDGEQPGISPVRFEVVPGALRLRVPARPAEASRGE